MCPLGSEVSLCVYVLCYTVVMAMVLTIARVIACLPLSLDQHPVKYDSVDTVFHRCCLAIPHKEALLRNLSGEVLVY